jgi:glycosyltransferase involved in cell wall biosynthesis
MAFFSVIIPLYNKEDYIEDTIKSALNQTFTDYEILVINDESTDKSKDLVLGFTSEKIHLYNQKNQGVSVARNLGIEKSKGKLIAFLDADDLWFPNHLEELSRLYHNFPHCGIYCSRYKIKMTKNHFQIPYFNGMDNSYNGIVKNYFLSNSPFRVTWTSSLAIPKEVLKKTGGFTPEVSNGQDLELWTKIGIHYPIAVTDQITAIYNNTILNSLSKKNINSMKLMNFDQFKIFEQQNSFLKNFLDLYRIEYALRFYTFGYRDRKNFYLKKVDKQNLSLKIRFLFCLPPFILRLFLKIKNTLKKAGVDFSIYG